MRTLFCIFISIFFCGCALSNKHFYERQPSSMQNRDFNDSKYCKDGYVKGIYITTWAQEECLNINDLGASYHTKSLYDCLPGFIEGVPGISIGIKGKFCLRVIDLGRKYSTHIKNSCIDGFTDGESIKAEGYDSKVCYRLETLGEKYFTSETQSCLPGYIERSTHKYEGYYRKWCLKE